MATGEIADEDKDKPAYINIQGIATTTDSLRVALKQA